MSDILAQVRPLLAAGGRGRKLPPWDRRVYPSIRVQHLHALPAAATHPSRPSPQVAANVDGSRNSGNAVLYECVQV